MLQDLYTITKTVNELKSILTGGKINKINQPNSSEVILTIYQKKTYKLILSTEAKFTRVSLLECEKENPKVAPNFCMLLRKHISNGEIKDISVINDDRIVKITIENLNDFQEMYTRELYIEVMGKYSNIFLVANGTILGALKTPPQDFEGKRLIIAGLKYQFPQKMSKIPISSKEEAIKILSGYNANEDKTNFIVSAFNEFSPITAREIVLRIERSDSKSPEEIYSTINSFLSESNPVIIEEKTGIVNPYPTDFISIEGKRTFLDSFNRCIFSSLEKQQKDEAFQKKKSLLTGKIKTYEKKELKKLKLLEEKEKSCSDAEKLKQTGELIVSYIYLIKPGMKEITLYDYTLEKDVLVKLDENLTASENAQKLFKKYNKEKKTLEVISSQKDEVKKELEYISGLYFEIDEIKDNNDFDSVYDELIMQGIIREQQTKKKKDLPKATYITYKVDGITIRAGRTNIQNDNLTFSSGKNCMWLHTKTYHSSHVIIESTDGSIPPRFIKIAAEICAYYSAGRRETKLDVDYTLKKFVKRQPGGKPGSVFYTDYSTIRVTPDSHDEFKI